MSIKPFTGASHLRSLLSDPSTLIVCPGIYDGLTARLALQTGFPALYMTGAGTSMSRLGWADLGLTTQTDMCENAGMIASLSPSTPLIADADTGYGGPIMVSRTVIRYARNGVAALHIEDQVQEKRCGHLLGKELVSKEVFYARLRAAVEARDGVGSDMLIIARTDARQSLGFEEAVERLREAVRIGVDAVFLEAMVSKEEMRRVCEIFKGVPCLLNSVPGGVTPDLTVDEAREMGFRIMIWPGITLEPVINSVTAELNKLKNEGTSSGKDNKLGVKYAFDICGLQECIEIDKRAGGKSYSTVNDDKK